MADIPHPDEVYGWMQEAEREYNASATPPPHPVVSLAAKQYYVEGYVRCKFREWVINAQVKAFGATIPQELGD